MPGDKKIDHSEPLAAGLKSGGRANLADQDMAHRKNGIPSEVTLPYSANGISSAKGGVDSKAAVEQGALYPPTSCYDYQYPGYKGSYSQMDGSGNVNSGGGSYTDNTPVVYYMPSYNSYAAGTFMGVDGQQPYFSSSEGMQCYSWNDTSRSKKVATSSNGTVRADDFNSKKNMNSFGGRSSNYALDTKSRQSNSSNINKSILQSQHLGTLNRLSSAYNSGAFSKGYQPSGNFSFAYQNQGLVPNYSVNYAHNGRAWNDNSRFKSREKSYSNGDSEELTRGPRAQSSTNPVIEEDKSGPFLKNDQYNSEQFLTKYDHAKFYVIKSYSEDDVHKCIKYDVWSSTPNGNKKLDIAFHDAEEITSKSGSKCPLFLFFSVNGSGQFVGVAEMVGPVDFEKNMDFWQLDKWSGFFPVKWHIIKDIPNTHLRHIILENNENRPVTYTRDTQEVGLKQGLEMLEIFKSYSPKTSLLDDLSFYENREKLLKAKRASKAAAFDQEKNSSLGEGSMGSNSMADAASSLIKLTRNLSLNSDKSKIKVGDKSAS